MIILTSQNEHYNLIEHNKVEQHNKLPTKVILPDVVHVCMCPSMCVRSITDIKRNCGVRLLPQHGRTAVTGTLRPRHRATRH